MSEFERLREQIGNRSVLVTSWYDDEIKLWHAGVPAYSHIFSRTELRDGCATRKAAIARVTGILAAHFSVVGV